ncbi:hypothetical protein R3W88_027854 [Solanum pinnatisectum]|uniref:Uncharacterized protein n=1 Tax=Solanum pinnatisectum TaxID=50273 RepID=A0AAV9LKR8_9SOLN|nr:hypothetical protein R3W88_027854 [Solanum pinnatisectum]
MELGTMQRCRTSYEIAQFSISRPLELVSMTLKTRSFGTWEIFQQFNLEFDLTKETNRPLLLRYGTLELQHSF